MSAIDIYKKICSEIDNGRAGVLATIIKTRGSTPASELSKMVILDGGARVEFEAPVRAVSPGQAAVFYGGDSGEVSLGGHPVAPGRPDLAGAVAAV